MRICHLMFLALAACVACGCMAIGQYHNAVWNQPLKPAPQPQAAAGMAQIAASAPPAPARASLKVPRQGRGNEKVLMYLALSGGGSRAAYLSTATPNWTTPHCARNCRP